MTRYRTRTGARRSGDDYQDLVAAGVLLTVLKHPSRYQWVKFEAKEAGKLDDVLALRTDGTVEATQVRLSTDALRSGDQWTWPYLLAPEKSGRSLIQAWCESVERLDRRYGTTEPQLFSNRRAGDDLFLTAEGRVDCGRTDPAILEQIRSQLGEETEGFLKRFRFQVDEQDLVDLEETLLRKFQDLGLPEENWLPFKDAIRAWIRGEGLSETGEIQVDQIRFACGWRRLSALPQNLDVPGDYTLPNPQFHPDFLGRVNRGSGSAIVLTAAPGVGKSTYLSYLVQELYELGQPTVRHHYALRATDDSLERLDSDRVAESLMADIMTELDPNIHELGNQSPAPNDLKTRLRVVGRNLAAAGTHLTVVIDGLDHVWRETDSREELTKLFDYLLPIPPGIVLIVGTQPVADQQLPISLLRHAPRECWVKLPRLDERSISEWLEFHRDLMPAAWEQHSDCWHRTELAASLYSRTEGHPLLMRYTVERIAHNGEYLTADSVLAMPPAPTASVEAYYRALWLDLSVEAKDVVFLLAIAKFSWPPNGLLECLQFAGYERRSSLTGVTAVRHLLAEDALGLSLFHRSMLLFATKQPEFVARSPALRKATIRWLKEEAPEYWQRSHLWLLQFEMGNPTPIIDGTDRRWVIEAVASGHPLVEIARVLQEAAWAAITQPNFPTYVDRGVLADAVNASLQEAEVLRWLFAAQLSLCTDNYLEPRAMARITTISDSHLLTLALFQHSQGRFEKTRDCFNEVVRRVNREANDLHWRTDELQRYKVFAKLAGLVRPKPRRFAGFLADFSTEDTKETIAESWVEGLRRSCDVQSALKALDEPISDPVRRCLSRHVAVVAADEEIMLTDVDCKRLASPYAWVYKMLRNCRLDSSPPEEPTPPSPTRDFPYGDYAQCGTQYVHDLFFFLVICEIQSPGFADNWALPSVLHPWLMSSLTDLAQGAIHVAKDWQAGKSIRVTAAYDATRSLLVPPVNDDMAHLSSLGIRHALRTILEDLLVLRRTTGGSSELNWPEVERIASHNFASLREVLQWVGEGRTGVDDDAIGQLCKALDDQLAATIEPFDERASAFSLLAAACAQHGLREQAEEYLRRASENLVAYGYHKDLLLHTALNAIEVSAEHFKAREPLWFGLAPAVAAVGKFTDGDHTSHLPARLGTLLLNFDPSLGRIYVKSLQDAEKYRVVEEILHDIVRTGNLSDPVVRALVSTCIEPEAIRLIEERAEASDLFAQDVLDLNPQFSASLADSGTRSPVSTKSPSRSDDSVPSSTGADPYLQFPPERLDELITSQGLARPHQRATELWTWFCSWAETDRAAEAYDAVGTYFFNDERLHVSNEMVAAVRTTVGRTCSYEWLVRAQRTNSGWNEYLASIEQTKERWESVQRDFPERWHQFLVGSIRPSPGLSPHFGSTVARIVEYLVFMGRIEEASLATSQIVETVGGLVSGQQLPIPDWVRQSSAAS
ncbi:MAG: ATP-binding protein [Truepera sp.]|nr:ATP-binding protein [Truepera sp.]